MTDYSSKRSALFLLLSASAVGTVAHAAARAAEPPLEDALPDLGLDEILPGQAGEASEGTASAELSQSGDDLSGTGDNDTFKGGPATLSRNDTVDGGGGEDTLTAGVAADRSGPETPTLRSVEVLFVNAQGGDLSMSNMTGVRELHGDQSSLLIVDATLDPTYGARGIESGTVTIDLDREPSGAADRLSLMSRDANVTFKARTDSQNAGIERISLAVVGESDKGEQVDISAFNALRQLAVTGPARVVLDLTSPNLTLVDASNNTGGIDLDDLNSATQNIDARGGAGDDLILTGTGDDTLSGGEGNDELGGEAGRDDIQGGHGDDTLKGNAGADTLQGGAGRDVLQGAGGADLIDGGDGADTVKGGNGPDTLRGGRGDDVLDGGGGRNVIEGGAGADRLIGGGQADLFEIVGADTVEGFAMGDDTLSFPDGTSLSSRSDFKALYDRRPGLFGPVEADQMTISITDGTATLSEVDTGFLNARD